MEFIRPYLSKIIRVCKKCGKVDVNTYGIYIRLNEKYILKNCYSHCKECGAKQDIDIKEELGGDYNAKI